MWWEGVWVGERGGGQHEDRTQVTSALAAVQPEVAGAVYKHDTTRSGYSK